LPGPWDDEGKSAVVVHGERTGGGKKDPVSGTPGVPAKERKNIGKGAGEAT